MKWRYEAPTRYRLPGRTYTVIRVDGRAFHTYTRDLARPYDQRLMEDLIETTRFLCGEVMGAKLAYAQSDEVSLVVTDFDEVGTQPWFDGSVQKIASVTASLATARFNQLRWAHPVASLRLATFDARAFTISDPVEVANYLIWRQRDATRNSISAAAQAHLPHRECHGRSGAELQELLWSRHRVNWNDYDDRFKRGTLVAPVVEFGDASFVDARTGETRTERDVTRRRWVATAPERWTVTSAELIAHVPGLAAAVATRWPRTGPTRDTGPPETSETEEVTP
jgi:tRNA(His) 5'-end guanylyltransferase